MILFTVKRLVDAESTGLVTMSFDAISLFDNSIQLFLPSEINCYFACCKIEALARRESSGQIKVSAYWLLLRFKVRLWRLSRKTWSRLLGQEKKLRRGAVSINSANSRDAELLTLLRIEGSDKLCGWGTSLC